MCAGRHLDLPVVHERAESPRKIHFRGFFLDQIRTDSDRYSEEKNNVRQHPFTHSYSEIRPFKRRFTRITQPLRH
ncbi:hypothetical protein EJ896_23760 [Klebsiella quasipneumoniae subsp. similipneumoniae]|nr:hypothetical protein EJ896_23760 [Klebsiella quasipneumoniae subsp. similipneumoniae]